jgi:predicted kinase
MAWVIDGNATGLREFAGGVLERAAVERLIMTTREEFDRRAALLDGRRAARFVRQGHGDLHLRNVVLLDGLPTLFDGVEFNDEIACTDVLYDLAFLLMDLLHRGLPRHANTVWNRYLAESGEFGGLQVLPLFLSCRAAVRAKTSATSATVQRDPVHRAELDEAAREYLRLAERFLAPAAPILVAIGGFSGSGKTTLAYELAPSVGAAPGAVVVRSDEIRKRLCGAPLLERLGPAGYAPAVTERVYRTMIERAAQVIAEGHTAIADAVFARPADRQAIARVAYAASVPFIGLWLDAPDHLLVARTAARRLDASDAGATVIASQREQGAGEIEWQRLDGSLPLAQVGEMAAGMLTALPTPVAVTRRVAESSR